MNNGTTSGAKLDALLHRQAAIRAALREEKDKQRALKQKEHERLRNIIGDALLRDAADNPDLKRLLKSTLQTAVTVESDRTFLAAKGWA